MELAALGISQPQLIEEFTGMRFGVIGEGTSIHLANLAALSELLAMIKTA
jgi:hypothetical protein